MNTIVGSISSGTRRTQDLIPAFLTALSAVNPAAYAQISILPFPLPPAYATEDDESEWWDSEECQYFLESLFETLDESAPDNYYFGSSEGDGANYGFWPFEED